MATGNGGLDNTGDTLWEESFIIGSVLETMMDGFILYDLDGTPLRWNKAYARLTGYSDDEIRTMSAIEFHPAEDITYVAESFGKVVETGVPMYIEARIKNKSGQSTLCSLSGSLLRNSEGEPVETREVDLKQVMEDVMAMSDEYLGRKGVEVEPDDDLGCLRANPTHIHQLLSNLMDNAIKHNAGRDLKIRMSYLGDDRDGGHRYLFRDNGSGVAPESTGKIFRPFYSGTNETGIGLATVARIVKVYGGSITTYNDGGACFEFVLIDYTRE